MKILTALALFLTVTFATAAQEDWATDLEAAFTKAKKENKNVLVEFTGSDWCPTCKKIDEEVFASKKFTSAASKEFILVKLDFPEKDKALAKKNTPYAEKYGVKVYPYVILFDAEGKDYSRFFANEFPSVEKFLAHLAKVKRD